MSAFSPRQMFALDEACKPISEAFDETPYLVGTAVSRQEYRDVDVRLIARPYCARHADDIKRSPNPQESV